MGADGDGGRGGGGGLLLTLGMVASGQLRAASNNMNGSKLGRENYCGAAQPWLGGAVLLSSLLPTLESTSLLRTSARFKLLLY